MAFTVRSGVSFCRPGDRTIFLDLPRDRYFCLSRDAERAFRELEASPERRATDFPALRAAVDDGLLRDGGCDAAAPATPPQQVTSSSLAVTATASIPQTLLMAARLATATLAIKALALERNVVGLARRKASLCAESTPPDIVLRDVAAALQRCGALVTPLDRCLPRSLATAHRLLDRHVAPTFILGVKLGPFEAHAWVQHGTTVVNDVVDNVRRFTPILVL